MVRKMRVYPPPLLAGGINTHTALRACITVFPLSPFGGGQHVTPASPRPWRQPLVRPHRGPPSNPPSHVTPPPITSPPAAAPCLRASRRSSRPRPHPRVTRAQTRRGRRRRRVSRAPPRGCPGRRPTPPALKAMCGMRVMRQTANITVLPSRAISGIDAPASGQPAPRAFNHVWHMIKGPIKCCGTRRIPPLLIFHAGERVGRQALTTLLQEGWPKPY